jgi:hypothetical protein
VLDKQSSLATGCDMLEAKQKIMEPEKSRIANADDYIPTGEFNPHRIRPWAMGNEYGLLAIAYASCEQEAFDEACDADLLKGLALDEATVIERETENEGEGVMRLGNASEPFDSIYAWIRELPNLPPDQLCDLSNQQLHELTK